MNNKWFDKIKDLNIKNKKTALINFIDNMLNKTQQIFEYKNLPDSIPEDILERMLQTNGNVFFHEVRGTLYVFTGGLGGVPDVYYYPTIYTIANPALQYSTSARIGIDGVLMKNDSAMQGLLPLLHKYGVLLTEMDISINNTIINTRDYNAFAAGDDRTKLSAEEYQRKIEAGETAVIAENQLLDGIRRLPSQSTSGTLRDLRETYQYLKSLLYSDLGLKTAFNMKSQYVSDEENIINDDTLLPLIDNMLECRQTAIEDVNKMYGLDIQVKLRGTWELQQEEVNRAIEVLEDENDNSLEVEGGEEPEGENEIGEVEGEAEENKSEENNKEEDDTEDSKEEDSLEINININSEGEVDDEVK